MSKIRIKQVVLDSNWTASGNADYQIKNIANPTAPQDAATKSYVDGIASGLDPKESVRFATRNPISGTYNSTGGTGGTGAFTGVDLTDVSDFDLDGGTVEIGDRILIKDQADATENGIYVVTTAGSTGAIERAEDHDGSPSNEVSSGNFTFVEKGIIYGGTGFVLLGDGNLTLNTDDLDWTIFSESTAFLAGNGIDISTSVISADINTNKGIEFDSGDGNSLAINLDTNSFEFNLAGEIALNENVAGDALGLTSGQLDVLYDDDTITLNGSGELQVDETALTIEASQVSDFNTAVSTEIFEAANFVDSLTIDFTVTSGTSVTASVIENSITASELNVSGNGTSGQVLASDGDGSFSWVTPEEGDITEVVAGEGLTGGGDSGSVTLDIGDGAGITVNADSIEVNVDDSTIEINGSDELQVKAGGITTNELDAADSGTAGNVLVDDGDGSMTWVAPDTVGPKDAESYGQATQTVANNAADSVLDDPFGSDTLAANVLPYVYLNGVKAKVGDGTTSNVDCWFAESGTTGTAKSFSALDNNDVLVWSGSNSGIAIDTDDEFNVVYQKQ